MTEHRHLDGNALGGVLIDIFGHEMTDVEGTCLDCGAVHRFGALIAYVAAPGYVLRCPSCSAVLLVIVVEPDGYHVTVESLQAPGV